jgi:hypothetical protein
MKIGGMVAASVLAAGIGTAQAQTAACNQMLLLQTSGLAQIKELRGVESKRDARSITYLSKTQAGAPPHLRDHLAPGRRQDHADRKACCWQGRRDPS